jgi:hypothetical protein
MVRKPTLYSAQSSPSSPGAEIQNSNTEKHQAAKSFRPSNTMQRCATARSSRSGERRALPRVQRRKACMRCDVRADGVGAPYVTLSLQEPWRLRSTTAPSLPFIKQEPPLQLCCVDRPVKPHAARSPSHLARTN